MIDAISELAYTEDSSNGVESIMHNPFSPCPGPCECGCRQITDSTMSSYRARGLVLSNRGPVYDTV